MRLAGGLLVGGGGVYFFGGGEKRYYGMKKKGDTIYAVIKGDNADEEQIRQGRRYPEGRRSGGISHGNGLRALGRCAESGFFQKNICGQRKAFG